MSIFMSININTGPFPSVLLTINRKRWWIGSYSCQTFGGFGRIGKQEQCVECDRFVDKLDTRGECFDCAGQRYGREMAEDMCYGRTMTLNCGCCGSEYQELIYSVKQWYREGGKYSQYDWLCPKCLDDQFFPEFDDYDYWEMTECERHNPDVNGIRLSSCHLCHSLYKVSDEEWAYVSRIEFDPATYAERFTCPTCRKNTKLLTDKAAAAASAAWEESVNQLPPAPAGLFLCETCGHSHTLPRPEWNPVMPGPMPENLPAPFPNIVL